jgi:hypothetical protein
MKKIILLLGIVSLLLNVSCSTTNHSYRANSIADKPVIAGQNIVDTKLDLKNKIELTSSKRNTVNEAIDEAYYRAIVDNNIDLVVDPIFEITTTDKILFWGGKSTAKLTGFGAKYDNSRSKVEAIKELKSVDTTDVKKFNAIYYNVNTDGTEISKSSTSKSGGIFGLFFGK